MQLRQGAADRSARQWCWPTTEPLHCDRPLPTKPAWLELWAPLSCIRLHSCGRQTGAFLVVSSSVEDRLEETLSCSALVPNSRGRGFLKADRPLVFRDKTNSSIPQSLPAIDAGTSSNSFDQYTLARPSSTSKRMPPEGRHLFTMQ